MKQTTVEFLVKKLIENNLIRLNKTSLTIIKEAEQKEAENLIEFGAQCMVWKRCNRNR